MMVAGRHLDGDPQPGGFIERFDHDERSEVGSALGLERSAVAEPVDEVLLGGEHAIAGKTPAIVDVVMRPLGLTQPLHRQGAVQGEPDAAAIGLDQELAEGVARVGAARFIVAIGIPDAECTPANSRIRSPQSSPAMAGLSVRSRP